MKATHTIGMEKEAVARIVADALCALAAVCAMTAICLLRAGALPFVIATVFLLLFGFAIFAEAYERIVYDDTHFEVRSLTGTERIAYADIVKIERVFIKHQTVRGGGHWRYHVQTKTADGSLKSVAVPFPQVATNEHLQDLFAKIRRANPAVRWALSANG